MSVEEFFDRVISVKLPEDRVCAFGNEFLLE